MIYTISKMTIKNETTSIVDRPIILYRGDRNVGIQFEILESMSRKQKMQGANTIINIGAHYGQLVLRRPDGKIVFSEVCPTEDGRITFTMTEGMINEIVELGDYSFQIRLYDETKKSRVTLPPVTNGITVLEPISITDK